MGTQQIPRYSYDFYTTVLSLAMFIIFMRSPNEWASCKKSNNEAIK